MHVYGLQNEFGLKKLAEFEASEAGGVCRDKEPHWYPEKLLAELEFWIRSAGFSFKIEGHARSAARNGSEVGLGGRTDRRAGCQVGPINSRKQSQGDALRLCGGCVLCSAVSEVYAKYGSCHGSASCPPS